MAKPSTDRQTSGKPESLEDEARMMLDEARMVRPGIPFFTGKNVGLEGWGSRSAAETLIRASAV